MGEVRKRCIEGEGEREGAAQWVPGALIRPDREWDGTFPEGPAEVVGEVTPYSTYVLYEGSAEGLSHLSPDELEASVRGAIAAARSEAARPAVMVGAGAARVVMSDEVHELFVSAFDALGKLPEADRTRIEDCLKARQYMPTIAGGVKLMSDVHAELYRAKLAGLRDE